MELPDSVAAIGERLGGDDAIVVDPQLLNGADVFAAERERLFPRPWVAVDHQLAHRPAQPLCPLRCRDPLDFADARRRRPAARAAQCLPPCRLPDLRGGTRVGRTDDLPLSRLGIRGRRALVEPDLSGRIDPARLRLASYPVCIRDGLIFVDLSRPVAANEETDAAAVAPGAVPAWLAEADVTRRARYKPAGTGSWRCNS